MLFWPAFMTLYYVLACKNIQAWNSPCMWHLCRPGNTILNLIYEQIRLSGKLKFLASSVLHPSLLNSLSTYMLLPCTHTHTHACNMVRVLPFTFGNSLSLVRPFSSRLPCYWCFRLENNTSLSPSECFRFLPWTSTPLWWRHDTVKCKEIKQRINGGRVLEIHTATLSKPDKISNINPKNSREILTSWKFCFRLVTIYIT